MVMRSMKEQTTVGESISRMTLHVSESSGRIREACVDQTNGSLRIQSVVESIQRSTST